MLYNNKDLYFKNKEFYFDKNLFDHIGYVDPNTIINRWNYKKDKPVDIYNLGTLLWEIISEKVPYSKDQNEGIGISNLFMKIINGYREDDVTDVPENYIELYKRCWDKNSSNRPSIYDIYKQIRAI